MNNTILECVTFFKQNKVYRRFFEALYKKYLSIGKVGGTIVISNLTDDEKYALSGLLRKDFSKQSNVAIRVSDFKKALDSTRFKSCSVEEILKVYFGEELVSNSQRKLDDRLKREDFFSRLLADYEGTHAYKWLESTLLEQAFGYHTIIKRYNSNSAQLQIDMNFVCQAINHLPVLFNSYVRLPVFAAKITSDPHTFDEGTSCGELLIIALSNYFLISKSQSYLERAELLYKAGILIDEVSNKVLCCGLTAYDTNGLHSGWEGFYSRNEEMLVTLNNLSNLVKIESPYKAVFVVENPAVFMSIRDICGINIPMVCTSGQINMAALTLLDLLVKSDLKIYYSGDFDPEGLLIADKLKCRYEDKLFLWRYKIDDYEKCISTKTASQKRIKQMQNIKTEELIKIAELIQCNGLCGYQEQIIEDLIDDINVELKIYCKDVHSVYGVCKGDTVG